MSIWFCRKYLTQFIQGAWLPWMRSTICKRSVHRRASLIDYLLMKGSPPALPQVRWRRWKLHSEIAGVLARLPIISVDFLWCLLAQHYLSSNSHWCPGKLFACERNLNWLKFRIDELIFFSYYLIFLPDIMMLLPFRITVTCILKRNAQWPLVLVLCNKDTGCH
jgi:hypothetical protein